MSIGPTPQQVVKEIERLFKQGGLNHANLMARAALRSGHQYDPAEHMLLYLAILAGSSRNEKDQAIERSKQMITFLTKKTRRSSNSALEIESLGLIHNGFLAIRALIDKHEDVRARWLLNELEDFVPDSRATEFQLLIQRFNDTFGYSRSASVIPLSERKKKRS